jgi:hypothetical protein
MRTSFFQAVIAAFVVARAASGCSCSFGPVPFLNDPNTAIFVGKVVKGGFTGQDSDAAHMGPVTLEVTESFSGPVPKDRQFQVEALFDNKMCSTTPYARDAVLLVVVERSKTGRWIDGMCTRTKSIESAKDELDRLRHFKKLAEKQRVLAPLVAKP